VSRFVVAAGLTESGLVVGVFAVESAPGDASGFSTPASIIGVGVVAQLEAVATACPIAVPVAESAWGVLPDMSERLEPFSDAPLRITKTATTETASVTPPANRRTALLILAARDPGNPADCAALIGPEVARGGAVVEGSEARPIVGCKRGALTRRSRSDNGTNISFRRFQLPGRSC
jgi:hypothetical protein